MKAPSLISLLRDFFTLRILRIRELSSDKGLIYPVKGLTHQEAYNTPQTRSVFKSARGDYLKKITSLVLFLNFSSCAKLIENIESLGQQEQAQEKLELKLDPVSYACPVIKNKFILASDQFVITEFQKFLIKFKITDHYEKILYLTLTQMKFTPHLLRPDSSVLYLEVDKSLKALRWDKQNLKDLPTVNFLYFLASKARQGRPLSAYLRFFDKNFQSPVKINAHLHSFIKKNKPEIKKSTKLREYYLKGSEILRENESLPKLSMTKILAKFKNTQKNRVSSHLFTHPKLKSLKCNFDPMLYNNGIYPIKKHSLETMSVALFDQAGLSHVSFFQDQQKLNFEQSYGPFPSSKIGVNRPNYCFNEKSKAIYISNSGRDPAQFIQHFFGLGVYDMDSSDEINQTLDFSRHLFLTRPRRILVETNRISKKELSALYQYRYPIYHTDSLGEVLIYAPGLKRLHLDGRSSQKLRCI